MALARLFVAVALLLVLLGGVPAVQAADRDRTVSVGGAVALQLVAGGLTSPVQLVAAPDGSGRLFVVDQIGVVRIVSPTGELLAEPFLDVRDRMVLPASTFDERGLLGLAFHPEYAANGRLFVYYSAPRRPEAPANWNHTSHVSEFAASEDPDRADPATERVVLQVDQPQLNHNGGTLVFGPEDGYLYVSRGDGGGAGDVGVGHTPSLGNGQDATNLLGSVLRIDVDGAEPYGIPADNPFVGTIARDEIFAYGLRNPYRMSFDAGGDRELLIADVGQNLWQEANLGAAGANYGWNIREGTHCFDPDAPTEPPAECPATGPLFDDPLVDPVVEYAHSNQAGGVGTAVIGGHVYRGAGLPQLEGRYVFGDWSTSFGEADGTLLAAQRRARGLWKVAELRILGRPDGRLGHYLLGLGEDAAGEVYVLTTDNAGPTGTTGRVYRLVQPSRG